MEMLIVIGIFGIMSAMVLINFRQGEHSTNFLLATEEVAANIRKAQTQTLTGTINEEILGSGGFGLYFDLTQPGQYLMFRDDGDQTYEVGIDTILETVNLPLNIALSNLTTDPLTVIFKPPKPTIYLNGDQLLSEVDIYLTSVKVTDKSGHINLNRVTGRVTAELEQL